MAPTPENAPCWQVPVRPREIYAYTLRIGIRVYPPLVKATQKPQINTVPTPTVAWTML